MKIDKTLQLPCGVEIKNRFLKSAMTEGVANSDALPNKRHVKLYERWAKGGTGTVSYTHLTLPTILRV